MVPASKKAAIAHSLSVCVWPFRWCGAPLGCLLGYIDVVRAEKEKAALQASGIPHAGRGAQLSSSCCPHLCSQTLWQLLLRKAFYSPLQLSTNGELHMSVALARSTAVSTVL